MKHLLIITLSFLVILSCKKDPTKKAFLYGRLINQCDGTPVSNEKIVFYQNFTPATSILSADKPEKILEEVLTDSDGYFYFTGDDYVDQSTSSIYNSSLRLSNGTQIAVGILGAGTGKNVQDSDPKLKNVGDILKEGMLIDINLKISSINNGVSYDSVLVYGFGLDSTELFLKNPIVNYFLSSKTNLLQNKIYWISNQENYGKYSLTLALYFYKNGAIEFSKTKSFYIQPCLSSSDLTFEF